jgi:exopolysaccharide biosynthesis protein
MREEKITSHGYYVSKQRRQKSKPKFKPRPISKSRKQTIDYDFVPKAVGRTTGDDYISKAVNEFRKNAVVTEIENIDNAIRVESINLDNTAYINENSMYVSSEHVTEDCKIGKMNIVVAYINTKHTGYKMVSRCCNMNVRDVENPVKGVAINTTYFNIINKFPIGFYREEDEFQLQGEPIPSAYTDYYRYVCVKPDSSLKFYKHSELPTIKDKDCPYVFAVGPMLIEKGNVVYNETSDNLHLFQCSSGSETVKQYKKGHCKDGIDTKVPENVVDCSRPGLVKPGDLVHGTNLNPRSMLITRKNNDKKGDIAFVWIEGRGYDGYGIDFKNQVILAKYLNATNAINLDGGGSAQLAMRSDTKDLVYHSIWTKSRSKKNPQKKRALHPHYHVGAVLEFTEI